MTIVKRWIPAACGLLALLAAGLGSAQAAEELYAPPAADAVRTQALAWVAKQGVKDEAVLKQAAKLWVDVEDNPSPRSLFDKVIATFSTVDPASRKLVEACGLIDAPLLAPSSAFLEGTADDAFHRNNLCLFYARYLTRRKMFDQALEQFADIDVTRVVDPASCLFFRAVCEHQLLMKKDGLATLKSLLKNTESVLTRYVTLGTLMQADLQSFKEKSLDEVARLMNDVKNRLGNANAGPKVQNKEEKIVALLDEIIEKLEEQSGGGGGGSGQGKGSNQPSSAADQSHIMGQKGPGEVDSEKFANRTGWGSLPPKERAKAKNLVDRNFPSHYKRAIDAYLAKLRKRQVTSSK